MTASNHRTNRIHFCVKIMAPKAVLDIATYKHTFVSSHHRRTNLGAAKNVSILSDLPSGFSESLRLLTSQDCFHSLHDSKFLPIKSV